MNIEEARVNMITQQLRTCGVLNQSILDVIANTPREYFVPEQYRDLAFADMNIPLGHSQVMSTPDEEAQMIQALEIKSSDKILEIGTGSGYVTALLAKLGQEVYSLDIFPDFTTQAQRKLNDLNLDNVTLVTDNAAYGWSTQAPYDVIVITGSLPYLPQNFRSNLNLGGRMFVVIGQTPIMEATLIIRDQQDQWFERKLFETVVPPLLHAPQLSAFTF